MPSPYDVIVVGSGPAGATAARYAARRGLKVLLVDKRKEIGVPVQCGEYVAHNEEVRAIFPAVAELDDRMDVPYRVREIDTPVIRIWSPNGRRYDIPFKGFTGRRDKMDQGITAQAVHEGAELMTETTVLRVHGDDVETNHGTFHGKVVIGSDGPRSTVAKAVGLEWPVSAPAMSATAEGEFSDATDMFFGNLAPGGYAWIIPKAGCANVGLGTWERFRGNLRELFNKFVAARGLEPGKATGGFVPVLGPPPRTVKDNVMLVGGASEVGRLGMILKKGPTSLLFDYGLLPRDPPQYPLPAPPVDGMFISHAHLDHTGMIPWVTRRQDVDVVLTPPTADVADLLLQDSLKIADAEGFDAPFDDGDLRTARRRFRTIDFGDNVDMGELEVTAHPAGHIPGATMYEVNGAETSLFTGDLHTLTTDLVWGAKPVPCDTLFIESTYAGRQHPERLKSEHAFLRKIEQVVNRGGLALVPSFAVGRTQDVILTLAKARHEVWLDGMGKKVNSIYVENPEYIKSVKALREAMHRVSVVRGPRDSEQAVEGEVVVTTSGTLDARPVLRYLEKIREEPRSAILLTGYQVEGTNGRRLVDEGVIDLYGVTVDIKCEWQKFDFSAHAGHDDLVRFIESCDPQRVILMHGENRQILADAVEGRDVLLPQEGNWYSI